MRKLISNASKLLDIVYPRECFLCRNPMDLDANIHAIICRSCRSKLIENQEFFCPLCQSPLPDPVFFEKDACFCCRDISLKLCGVVSITKYHQGPYIKEILMALKHGGRMDLAYDLSELLNEQINHRFESIQIDAITAVPLHRKRLRFRGYNQAALIAQNLAIQRNLPFYPWLLTRIKKTKPQSGGRLERERNVKSAFSCEGICKNANIMIVDDVITTGATILECCKKITRAGARSVLVAICAWVPIQRK